MSYMKKLYFFIILCLSCSFISCVDIVERYNFKANGACDVIYDFDMGRAVTVLHNLMSDSVAATPQFAMVKDTVMNLYNALPDSTQTKMSAEEMKLAQSSNLAVNMNLKRDIMRVSIRHEANSPADLEYYLQRISKLASYNEVDQKKGNHSIFNAQQLIAGQECYAYQVTQHKFIRIIDKVKFNTFLKKTQSTFAMAKAMLIEMPYKVVLNFAKSVKNIDNRKAILSADRRQVTLQTNMDELIKNPTVMNLHIDF
jgi:hypothetical protein